MARKSIKAKKEAGFDLLISLISLIIATISYVILLSLLRDNYNNWDVPIESLNKSKLLCQNVFLIVAPCALETLTNLVIGYKTTETKDIIEKVLFGISAIYLLIILLFVFFGWQFSKKIALLFIIIASIYTIKCAFYLGFNVLKVFELRKK